uniref:zinc finger protein 280D-like n=1 Tax=Callospermophilus lateralis TaxID=76772 RepID=UPI004038C855
MGENPFQPKDNLKMAELFIECEEEELEPWQKKVKEVEDNDDDEPIFVGEISSSKPAISNILNRVNPSSYSRGIKNGILSRGITAAFKPTSQNYTNPTSNPVAASPVNFHPESRSSDSSVIVQPFSKPVFLKLHSQPRVMFDIINQYQQYSVKILDCHR